jgi:xanthine dehydrogenase YagS FAD-binding subunit
MKNFQYTAARDVKQAVALLGDNWTGSRIMAGGTDLLDEMKERLVQPDRIIHLQSAPLGYVKSSPTQILIGAMTTLATLESHPILQQKMPGLAQAAASIATPQIRNAGTVGGNLCQRPRCWYYRNNEFPCLKKGGSTCYAKDGASKYNAILGGGPSYIVHPSDLAPMLMALNASVRIAGPRGERVVALDKFFVLPKQNIERENILQPNEIVTEIIIPAPAAGSKSTYLKFKERETQDFALASAAVSFQVQNGVMRNPRVVLGGVAPIPWRSVEAEKYCRPEVNSTTGQQAAEPRLNGQAATR